MGTRVNESGIIDTTESITIENEWEREQFSINPYIHDMIISMVTCPIGYTVLGFTSLLILYIILKHYRDLTLLYLPIVFYSFCQLQLLVFSTATWSIEARLR